MPVDNVLLEIMKNRFQAIVGEMGQAIQRTGHTVFIKETADFGSVLSVLLARSSPPAEHRCHRPHRDTDGQRNQAVSDYQDGDVLIANDPTSTGAMATPPRSLRLEAHLCRWRTALFRLDVHPRK